MRFTHKLFKKTIAGPSHTHGWGCFLLESVEKHEFIMEYTGELITIDEAERRGQWCDVHGCSFIFTLNEEDCIDAMNKGNNSKFINHKKDEPNATTKIWQVNGDHRVGIFALDKPLKAGTELFFCYGEAAEGMLKNKWTQNCPDSELPEKSKSRRR